MDKNIYILGGAVAFAIGYLIISSIMLYKDFKKHEKRKHDLLLDKVSCLCGHRRWYHTSRIGSNPDYPQRCHDFTADFSSRCPCTVYRMNNLEYLELLEKSEREPEYYV